MTALLIIDMQNDYFKGGEMELVGAEEASLNAKGILEKFRQEGKPVVHIQHISTRPSATFFISGTKGVGIHKNVAPNEGEEVISKHYPNSFRETGLLEYLRKKNITRLVVCGMMTHMCVDSTVRAAKDFGFDCTVIGDACATKDLVIEGKEVKASEVQKAFLGALNYFYSEVQVASDYTSL